MAKKLIRLNYLVFVGLALLNLLGVFMPELGFDALWYHLTLSKLFLVSHQWYFPGGLYYYSAMPRLGELIGMPLLSLFGFIGPKFIQYLSGLSISFILYRLSKKFTSNILLSITAVNLFYATWLVSWQSSSAYIDLIRTAFELIAFYLLTRSEVITKQSKILAGLFMGLAIGVKWHSIGSLILMALIFSPSIIPTAILVASPWFYLAYHFTGNPVHPLFEKFMTMTQIAQVEPHFYSITSIAKRIILSPLFLTKPSEDFLSPIMGIVFVISLFCLISGNKLIRKISLFGLLGTILLLLTPPPSTRYFLPYLPAIILSCVYLISKLRKEISLPIVAIFTFSSFLVLGLRLSAFAKFIPYLTGKLTLNQFLTTQSYRLPDTFIDSDNYVKDNLPANASYAISNLHNLYYFPYNFDHDSFVDNNKHYDYLVTKNTPAEEVSGELIHINPLGIEIFKL